MPATGTPLHLAFSVKSMDISVPFYRHFLGLLGYVQTVENQYYTGFSHKNGSGFDLGFSSASQESPGHVKGNIGFHHLAFNAASNKEVDLIYQAVVKYFEANGGDKVGKILDPPYFLPAYGDNCYAFYFTDPDGLKMEVAAIKQSTTRQFYRHLLVGLLAHSESVQNDFYSGYDSGDFHIGFTPAKPDSPPHVKGHVGLHHLAFHADSKEKVDEVYESLVRFYAQHGGGRDKMGKILDPPQLYPEYGEFYYALYFTDPDGIKLEIGSEGPSEE
ncbi:hypothetical protein DFQ27_008027 [Actinomortierella ambigua]|uniref:VOC domain-containing protein n=1 Tax=Actinomortierella ambigua TaxID=1343610 RepID=A0A9P6PU07_9FUNG|nr:hypothetical protein DFQ27_008027 [Actinomortierella ambigua]